MICVRCGNCCITMDVIIPITADDGVWACMKPRDAECPHLSFNHETMEATCSIHDTPEYEHSPCWCYGNSDVDPDFAPKRGRPCPVGELIRREGGLKRRDKRVGKVLGPWPYGSEET